MCASMHYQRPCQPPSRPHVAPGARLTRGAQTAPNYGLDEDQMTGAWRHAQIMKGRGVPAGDGPAPVLEQPAFAKQRRVSVYTGADSGRKHGSKVRACIPSPPASVQPCVSPSIDQSAWHSKRLSAGLSL